jgi:hypothetical protein
MAKMRIFVSCDHHHDRNCRNRLLAWDADGQFEFSSNNMSADVSVDSRDAAIVKRVVSGRIRQATHFVCLVGEHTHDSAWVAWEINTAVALRKPIVAVKIERSYVAPRELYGIGASWALSFTFASVKRALGVS